MTREDIEKAAVEFANDKCQKRGCSKTYRLYFNFDRYDIEQSFETGAGWRINSVWHDAKDVPQPFSAFVILHDTENDFMMLTQHSITCDSDYNVIYQENDNMIAWAYIEDLIPNTEE